jgi:hypothetical protein
MRAFAGLGAVLVSSFEELEAGGDGLQANAGFG